MPLGWFFLDGYTNYSRLLAVVAAPASDKRRLHTARRRWRIEWQCTLQLSLWPPLTKAPKAASVYQLSEIWPKGLAYSLQSTHIPDTAFPLKIVEFLLYFLTFTDPTFPEYPNPPLLQMSLDSWSLAWLPDQPQPSPFSEPPGHFHFSHIICHLPFLDPFLYKPYVP